MWETLWLWFQEPAHRKLAVAVGAAFALGLGVGVWRGALKRRLSPRDRKGGDRAFLKGVQYILSNDHDHAIEEFTKSVQLDSETIETYVALGNLYRSKGDIGRAIRIRQSIILRPNIDPGIRLRALFDLGVDYRKGGFVNRALKTFQEVIEQDPASVETLEEMERLHEEMKDWQNAYNTRRKIARLTSGDHRHILAHHLVETGKELHGRGEVAKAKSFFLKAISTHAGCIDAYLHLGDLYFGRQEFKKAVSTWKKVVEVDPRFTFLAYRRLEKAYAEMDNLRPVEAFLEECAKRNPDAFTRLAFARFLYNKGDMDGAVAELDRALELEPSFLEARKFKGEILLRHGLKAEALEAYGDLLAHLDVPYLTFQCTRCGIEFKELQWQCPQCKMWDSMVPAEATVKTRPSGQERTSSRSEEEG